MYPKLGAGGQKYRKKRERESLRGGETSKTDRERDRERDTMAAPPGGPGSAASSPSLQPGVIIKGKWNVVKKIGQGAFGTVNSYVYRSATL
jgi:hypothetical protein